MRHSQIQPKKPLSVACNIAKLGMSELLLVKHRISQIAGRNAEGLAGDL